MWGGIKLPNCCFHSRCKVTVFLHFTAYPQHLRKGILTLAVPGSSGGWDCLLQRQREVHSSEMPDLTWENIHKWQQEYKSLASCSGIRQLLPAKPASGFLSFTRINEVMVVSFLLARCAQTAGAALLLVCQCLFHWFLPPYYFHAGVFLAQLVVAVLICCLWLCDVFFFFLTWCLVAIGEILGK